MPFKVLNYPTHIKSWWSIWQKIRISHSLYQ